MLTLFEVLFWLGAVPFCVLFALAGGTWNGLLIVGISYWYFFEL